jgi:hypothetical protein
MENLCASSLVQIATRADKTASVIKKIMTTKARGNVYPGRRAR